ncbi:MAG: amidohydrolase family protein [Bryobacterales bacterium]|nr:amidohydrolase family protein [Bryobacterales bacterium]
MHPFTLSRRQLLAATSMVPLQAAGGVKVIDAHAHLFHHSRPSWREDERKLIHAADKLKIDVLCCSVLPPDRPMTLEGCIESNRMAWEGAKRFARRILPYCTINPGYGKAALDEVRRCIHDRGFIGIKLYNDYRTDEPVYWPLTELAIELRVPMLQHSGHTTWLPAPQPRISDAAHIAALAARYPEAMIICAHIAGGGDWEWTAKALRHAKSVYLDLSGSNIDEGTVELAHRILGPERLLFACDMSMTASVGRIRGAAIPEDARRKILGANMQHILDRRSKA